MVRVAEGGMAAYFVDFLLPHLSASRCGSRYGRYGNSLSPPHTEWTLQACYISSMHHHFDRSYLAKAPQSFLVKEVVQLGGVYCTRP